MKSKADLEKQVFTAAREQGITSVLLRNAVSRSLGLSVTDMECLSLLVAKGISTPKELAQFTGMTPGAATAMLDRLEKAKFIRRTPNPDDRRGVLIEIESMQMVWSKFSDVQRAQGELIASYTVRELVIIADFLTRFAENVQRHTKLIEEDSAQDTK